MNRNRKCMSGVAAVLVFALILSSFGISVFAESGLKTFTPAKAAVGPDAYWPYFDEWNASKVFPSFAVRFKAASSFTGGMMALNDRLKLRSMVVAETEDMAYVASEECAIRRIAPDVTNVWAPRGGQPVIFTTEGGRA